MLHTPYRRVVNYYETDMMGWVHHSNYIRYFEEARVANLDEMGAGQAKLETFGIISPVTDFSCVNIKPTRFAQELIIECRLTKYNGVRICFEYEVLDATTGELCAKGKSSHCFLNTNNNHKPTALQKSVPEAHEAVLSYMEKMGI